MMLKIAHMARIVQLKTIVGTANGINVIMVNTIALIQTYIGSMFM